MFIVSSYLWLQYLPLTGNRWNFYAFGLASLYFILFMCAEKCVCLAKIYVAVFGGYHFQPQAKVFALVLIFQFSRFFLRSLIEFRQFSGLTKSFSALMNLYVLFVQRMQKFWYINMPCLLPSFLYIYTHFYTYKFNFFSQMACPLNSILFCPEIGCEMVELVAENVLLVSHFDGPTMSNLQFDMRANL